LPCACQEARTRSCARAFLIRRRAERGSGRLRASKSALTSASTNGRSAVASSRCRVGEASRGLAHTAAALRRRRISARSEAAAIFLSQAHGKALFLRDESWALARVPDGRADYQIALWQALAAQGLQADDYRAVFVEGAARHRLGNWSAPTRV